MRNNGEKELTPSLTEVHSHNFVLWWGKLLYIQPVSFMRVMQGWLQIQTGKVTQILTSVQRLAQVSTLRVKEQTGQ